MAVQSMAWAFEQDLEPQMKFILVALANFADANNECWPSVKRLKSMTGLGESTIRAKLADLELLGMIKKTPRFRDNGSQTASLYLLDPPPPVAGPLEPSLNHQEEPSLTDTNVSGRTSLSEGEILVNKPSGDKFRDFVKGRQEGARKLDTKEPEYDNWPEVNTHQEKENPQVKNLNSKNLAIDFQEQTRVHFGQLVVTDIPALAGSLARFHKAGIPYEEIKACLDYFFQMPSKYMWKDAIPWRAFVKNWLKIRKDCDWTDPNDKPAYKPIMKRPVGSRKIIYND